MTCCRTRCSFEGDDQGIELKERSSSIDVVERDNCITDSFKWGVRINLSYSTSPVNCVVLHVDENTVQRQFLLLLLRRRRRCRLIKMKNPMSITSFEDLSNDILLEIFDKLKVFHLYRAFVHLNHRFDQLLFSPSLRLKVELGYFTADQFKNSTYKQFLLHHRQRIESLSLESRETFSLFSIDSSFIHLQCLSLCDIDLVSLRANLNACISLPHLSSLNVKMKSYSDDLGDVYQAIFRLPTLQYLKCSMGNDYTPTLLSFPSDQRPSAIKQLVVAHACTGEQLAALLSYLPALRHLSVSELHPPMERMSRIVMPNLRSISLNSCWIEFDELQLFLSPLDAPLETLSVKNGEDDESYLDGTRWEMLISEFFPDLKVFNLEFYHDIELEHGSLYLHDLIGFDSPFWAERNWMCEVEADSCDATYQIRPYKSERKEILDDDLLYYSFRKQWYDLESSCQSDTSLRLSLTCSTVTKDLEWYAEAICEVCTETPFRHLEFRRKPVDLITLLNIITQFTELDSLKIHSLSVTSNSYVSVDTVFRRFLNNDNQITKVFLETITEIDVVDFLTKLCPQLYYLHIDCINTTDVKGFIRSVLSKLDQSRSAKCHFLSFRLPTINDEIFRQLNELLYVGKPIRHYTIQRQQPDRICFERRR